MSERGGRPERRIELTNQTAGRFFGLEPGAHGSGLAAEGLAELFQRAARKDRVLERQGCENPIQVFDTGGAERFFLPHAGAGSRLTLIPKWLQPRWVGLQNVCAYERDFVARGTGLPDAATGYVMLFNILHCEEPSHLLQEACAFSAPAGY